MRSVNTLISTLIYCFCVFCVFCSAKPLIVEAKEIIITMNDEIEKEDKLKDNIFRIADVDSESFEDSNDYKDSDIVEENNETEQEEMINNEWEIMVIFCFGLIAGVIVGHFLTGFIK